MCFLPIFEKPLPFHKKLLLHNTSKSKHCSLSALVPKTSCTFLGNGIYLFGFEWKKAEKERRRVRPPPGCPLARCIFSCQVQDCGDGPAKYLQPPGVYTPDIYLQFRHMNVQRPRTTRSSVRLKCEGQQEEREALCWNYLSIFERLREQMLGME